MTDGPDRTDGGVPDLDLTSQRGGAGSTPDLPGGGASPDEDSDAKPADNDGDPAGDDAADNDGDPAGPDDDEVEPVELLVQLAEEGEIEPWDIDIVRVTDAFLEKLDETDLRTTGRALFYASVLLRMKSDGMLADDDETDEAPGPEPWEAAMEGGAVDPAEDGFDPVDQLEAEMDRRLDRKHTRGSPETLDELVRELREAERGSWWKDSREYDTTGSPSGHARGTQTVDYHTGDEFRSEGEPTAGEATERTHDEDIEEVIDDIEGVLRTHFDRGRTEVLFAEIETAGGRPFMTYLALLFMAHRGSIRLQQDDLFGDLWVKDPAAATADSEAVAD
ncbi:segregation/condensation protein A [Halorubrum sp. CBA1125]|uniref:segregation and condensation protein A n=1 Tax=Halorubrum sp. CBA1125 TaxID=2668072 RepID=UPI0012E718C6|nr:ScpA family protein [Halorubrum sp. CBA1125]MUW15108.1 segregation/condensation protein A [Halorubrum sp. CBA1125]